MTFSTYLQIVKYPIYVPLVGKVLRWPLFTVDLTFSNLKMT